MFDVTSEDIRQLNDDAVVRRLVALLCEAECRRVGLPVSGVTAGGHQDAPDGGVDVRVSQNRPVTVSGFIPRAITGFQVKASKFTPKQIGGEMRPKGEIRPVIKALAQDSGAYVIVSSKSSVTDSGLRQRHEAMLAAVGDVPNADALHLDYYDSDRLATWARQHPGIACWVLEQAGRSQSGWRAYGDWSGSRESLEAEYLLDDRARIVDEANPRDGELDLREGLRRIRVALSRPASSVRLVGLSGTGKTRLAQALFDDRVGVGALDSALAVYADVAAHPTPSPRELVQRLARSGMRALVVVDNCPPDAHRALTDICKGQGGRISLLTIEYDVADDLPEETDVFRLGGASDDVIKRLIERRSPEISAVNRSRIADFANGNARVALAVARAVKGNENIAHFADTVLFDRLFRQANQPDGRLLRVAEACCLAYSFDGEDIEGDAAEVPVLADLAGVSVDEFYGSVSELIARDLVQRRGKWRALLPQALANRLALQALEKTPPSRLTEMMLTQAPERLSRSFTRRLGYLHESRVAQAIVADCLQRGGRLADVASLSPLGVAMFTNVAPVAPEAALAAIEAASQNAAFLADIGARRSSLIAVVRSIAYDPPLFHRAALLLARFWAAEPDGNNRDSASEAFTELFRLHLSGTQATPPQRLDAVEALLSEPALRNCALEALHHMLEGVHFVSTHSFDFGARPRDYGWSPQIWGEQEDWFRGPIAILRRLALSHATDRDRARSILATRMRYLWASGTALNDLEDAIAAIAADRFWPEGWIALRSAMRFDGGRMPNSDLDRLRALERRLRPATLLDSVRAYVVPHGYGGIDDDTDDATKFRHADERARELGREIADQGKLLDEILPELTRGRIARGGSFGAGLGEGATDLREVLRRLVAALPPPTEDQRDSSVLRGFLHVAAQRDAALVSAFLDEAVDDPKLDSVFPLLQASVEIDAAGVDRLIAALRRGGAPLEPFRALAFGRATDPIASQDLRRLLFEIMSAPGGLGVAVEILAMRLRSPGHPDGAPVDAGLVACGRELLIAGDFGQFDHGADYYLSVIAETCFHGAEGGDAARQVCRRLRASSRRLFQILSRLGDFLAALLRAQPEAVLDELFDGPDTDDTALFLTGTPSRRHPLNSIPAEKLMAWARLRPAARFPVLASALRLFDEDAQSGALNLSAAALAALEEAPDRGAVLEAFTRQLLPCSGWSGEYADVLDKRRCALAALSVHYDLSVAGWATEQGKLLEQTARADREKDHQRDESFE